MVKKKDRLYWVALDKHGKIVGYLSSTYNKGRRQGIINEIVVDPAYDFKIVARPLVNKICDIFLEKNVASIHVATIRNPHYSKVFSNLGFFNVETDAVFMLAVHDIQRFLDEITPILVRRFGKLQNWDGWLQVSCGEHSKFFRKDSEKVQPFVWTNHEVDLKISLNADDLAGLFLGVITFQEALEEGKIKTETTLPKDKINKLLTVIFPKKQFLAFDFW